MLHLNVFCVRVLFICCAIGFFFGYPNISKIPFITRAFQPKVIEPPTAPTNSASFSFLSFDSMLAPTWAHVIDVYGQYRSSVLARKEPCNARFLHGVPSWNRLGLANNMEAMALSLFASIITERVLILPESSIFNSIFQQNNITVNVSTECFHPSINAAKFDYPKFSAHLQNGKSASSFMDTLDVFIDDPPDACGFPYSALYDNPIYKNILKKLGDWRKPIYRYLFRFRKDIEGIVDQHLTSFTLHDAKLVTVQLRYEGIWRPPPELASAVGSCLCGLIPQRRLQPVNVVIVSDLTGEQRLSLLKNLSASCRWNNSTVRLSPSNPAHIVLDPGAKALAAAAFDLLLIARASLAVLSPASSFGYVGLYLGDAAPFLLDPQNVQHQCSRKNERYLQDAYAAAAQQPTWWSPSYDSLASCSQHDPNFVR